MTKQNAIYFLRQLSKLGICKETEKKNLPNDMIAEFDFAMISEFVNIPLNLLESFGKNCQISIYTYTDEDDNTLSIQFKKEHKIK